MFNQCSAYELQKSPECSKSLKISQLQSQLVQLEEDDKAYNDLLQQYRQLQNEYQLMNDAKLHLEYELKQKNESTNKLLNDLKCQNIDLTNELTEKNSIYEKLFADNSNLLNNLNERKKENEAFCKTSMDNDKLINLLNQEKAKCEKDAVILDNTTHKNEEDIHNLCNKLDSLKLKNKSQNENINLKNMEINTTSKSLNELKNTNSNINSQINLKHAELDNLQKQLDLANKSILDLREEINALDQNHNLGKDQLQKLKIEYQNEYNKRLKAQDDNVNLEAVLKDRDDTISRLTCVNEALKSDSDKLIIGKNKLMDDMDRYKSHILILTQQTEKIANELERIINENNDAYNLNNNQIQRLQKVIYDNKKILQEEIEALNALENYVKSQPGIKVNDENNDGNRMTNNSNNNQTKVKTSRKTYSRQNQYNN